MYAIFSSPVLLVFHVYIQRVAYKYQPFSTKQARLYWDMQVCYFIATIRGCWMCRLLQRRQVQEWMNEYGDS
jgi:hypothetical protein